MKVLIINCVCGFGSTGRICTDLADSVIANGDECRIAFGRNAAPEQYQAISYRICGEWKVRENVLKCRLLDHEGFHSKKETKRFVQWIREYDPDVIHLHNLHGYYLNLEVLFSYLRSCEKKIIWTFHDCWPITGHCSHFIMAHCEQWKSLCQNCSQTRNYPKCIGRGRAARNFQEKKELFSGMKNMTIVTPSQWLANVVRQSFLKNTEVVVIPNGIDTSIFHKQEIGFRGKYGLQNKKVILGVSSVWTSAKGYDDFIRLSNLIDRNCAVVLVGLNQKQLASLPSTIVGIHRTNDIYELAGIYSEADVLFNPTYQDTYPTVNLEAQACGTPVITYRGSGGSEESVPNENTIPLGDLQAFLQKLNGPLSITKNDLSKRYMIETYLRLYQQ